VTQVSPEDAVSGESLWLLLKNLFFLVLVPGTFGFYVPLRLIVRRGLSSVVWGPLELAALAPVAAGAAGLVWCIWHFGATGRGTPAPFDPPTRLVVRGLYRHVRNPMYLSLLCVILGWALLLRSLAIVEYAAGCWLLIHLFVIGVEEPGLRARFGEPYAEYCRAVRRWVPGRRYQPKA